MLFPHIRRTDLNLLLAALMLLEERQVSAAAQRFGLSQPAMSRLLHRLRTSFGDELLVRRADGYDLTARARELRSALDLLLPQIERLIEGPRFDPQTAQRSFRFALTDYAALVVAPRLTAKLSESAPQIGLDLQAWSDRAFSDLERGRLDFAFWVEDAPPPLEYAELFKEDFVCVLDVDHPAGRQPLTVERYLAYPHIVIGVLGGQQTVIERRLERLGIHRTVGLRVPFFAASALAVPNTQLIATIPRRMAKIYESNPGLRIVAPPIALGSFSYILVWHPRLNGDPGHAWLRETIRHTLENV